MRINLLKLLKENFWLINYYNLVNYITFYHRYLILVEDIHNLIFLPLVISDGDIINTFYFLRFFFSFNSLTQTICIYEI